MATPLHPVLSIRLFQDEKCFGRGIAQLLRLVDEHHSLRAAAQAMGMAYSKAWTIVRRCETVLGFPLLSFSTGGSHGGGAVMTQEGRALLEAYEAYTAEVERQAQLLFTQHFTPFLPAPEASHGDLG